MCGLVGCIHKTNYGFWTEHFEIFGNMLSADTIRGDDSTGMFGVSKAGNVNILKAAIPGMDFVRTEEFKKLREPAVRNWTAMIGHNRAATKGAITAENAHPFRVNHITLVQNGTDYSHNEVSSQYEVDSHALTAKIAAQGHWYALDKLQGPYALIWYDKKLRKIFFGRNSGRPLFLVESPTAWFLSSEVGLPLWLLGRGTNSSHDIKDIRVVDPDCLYSFDMTKDRQNWIEEKKPSVIAPTPIPTEEKPRYRAPADGGTPILLAPPKPAPKEDKSKVQELNLDGEYVQKLGKYARNERYIFRPYDYKETVSESRYSYILFELIDAYGNAVPGWKGRLLAEATEVPGYLPGSDNQDRYFVGTIERIFRPRDEKKDKVMILATGDKTMPIEIKTGMSSNGVMFSEEWFKGANFCPACQHPNKFDDLHNLVAFSNTTGKMKLYCKGHEPAVQAPASQVAH